MTLFKADCLTPNKLSVRSECYVIFIIQLWSLAMIYGFNTPYLLFKHFLPFYCRIHRQWIRKSNLRTFFDLVFVLDIYFEKGEIHFNLRGNILEVAYMTRQR